ncbi:MAG: GMC family oxidoreductase [Flavisolibacter sp.]
MHIDAKTLPNNSIIEGDIVIVGAGAAGISIAMEWANTPYKVILLEGGGFEYDEKVQALYEGKATGQRYYPLKSSRLHYFGGTTGHWAGFCSTFDEIDFEKRDWIPESGWPIQRKDLDTYYERAHKYLDLGAYNYSEEFWKKKDPSLEGLSLDPAVIWNKIWQFSPPTRYGKKYKETILKSKNIHLYTYANVVNILANENVTSIRELITRNYAGKEHRVRAKYIIVACCAIQNARLLLSANYQAPKGLGNENDLVGRYFMEHLEMKSGEAWFSPAAKLGLYSFSYQVTKARAELAISAQKQRELKILNGTVSLSPLAFGRNLKPTIDIWKSTDPQKNLDSLFAGFAAAAKKAATEKISDRAFELYTRIEQAPNPNSRVTLDSEKDSLGMPRAMLHWTFTGLEKTSIRKMYELLGQQIGKAGLGRVKILSFLQDEKDQSMPESTGAGWHHMGTTRMSDNPKKGVVDKNCKVNGISNLFMAGSSCYVTAAAPNPTLTLVALSLRLSDYVKESIRNHKP